MTPPPSSTFGSMLRRYRRAAGLSQEALAALAGLSTHAVGDLERGYRSRPHQDTVARLMEALELSESDRALLEAAVRRSRGMQVGISPSTRDLTALMIGVPPGVGRTRLLYEMSRGAIAQGWRVLIVRCHGTSSREPYGPLLDLMFEILVHQTTPEQQVSLSECGWPVNSLPELAGMMTDIPGAERPQCSSQERLTTRDTRVPEED
jgi:transcriptional regulator with XRE-family HTH domain